MPLTLQQLSVRYLYPQPRRSDQCMWRACRCKGASAHVDECRYYLHCAHVQNNTKAGGPRRWVPVSASHYGFMSWPGHVHHLTIHTCYYLVRHYKESARSGGDQGPLFNQWMWRERKEEKKVLVPQVEVMGYLDISDELTGWHCDWLAGAVIDWLVLSLTGWQCHWLADTVIDWLVLSLTGWYHHWLPTTVIDWLVMSLTGWYCH